MNLLSTAPAKLKTLKAWFWGRSTIVKIIIIALIAGIGWFGYTKLIAKKTAKIAYSTVTAAKDTLVISISTSGQVSTANSASVSTNASGVVSKVYVTNGQKVQSGDKLADIDLDLEGKQRAAQAYASYQSAQNALNSANAALYTTQSDMFTQWQTYLNLAQNATYQNADLTPNTQNRQAAQFISTNDNWLASEAKYQNQQSAISQAQTSLGSAWLSYQQSSPSIYAPISGTLSGFSLQVGSVLTTQTASSGTPTSQNVANIITDAEPTITINLTQIDAPKVKVGNKATVTFDAIPNKTFTGVVVSIDIVGSVSSGVSTYPAVIKLDSVEPDIYANMSATASIITQVKNDVLLIPSSAVVTQNGQSIVRTLKNGKVTTVNVETGLSSASQIEITSGLTEGSNVITNYSAVNSASTRSTTTTGSAFSGFGGNGGAGGAIFRATGR